MGVKLIKAYFGSWESEYPFNFFIPYDNTWVGGTYRSETYNIATATAKTFYFDHTCTFFTYDEDTKNAMKSAGFTSVYWVGDGGDIGYNVKIWISSRRYFYFTSILRANFYSPEYVSINSYSVNYQSAYSGVAGTLNGYTKDNKSPAIEILAISSNTLLFTFELNDIGTKFYKFWDEAEIFTPSTDPYDKGGTSGSSQGGRGTFDNTTKDIEKPSLPSLIATQSGFISLFTPTLTQLQNLASYMWTGLFDLDNFRKLFADPMDCIIGLSIVPVAVPVAGSKAVTVGNISTGVSLNYTNTMYVDVDCGVVNMTEYWGSYLDYDPYTKIELYLPYIGIRQISADDVMSKSIGVSYRVNILDGSCIAFITSGSTVLYQFVGQCSQLIPISGDNWNRMIQNIISIAGSAVSMVAGAGGLSAAAGLGMSALQTASANDIAGAIGNVASSSQVADVLGSKPRIAHSGAMSGSAGLMGIQTPYMIITRARQCLPEYQNTYTGYPSYTTKKLSKLSGFTMVYEIHLENISATDDEKIEIERILKGGFII